jgi:anti-sigma factor RsiW
MPLEGKADLAHTEAADWVMGTLGPAQAEDFQRHLTGCPHCQAAVAEFGQLGQMLQHLPPAAEPPPRLEARTITGVLAAAIAQSAAVGAEDQTATKVQQSPATPPAAADTSSPTQLIQIPATPPEAEADERPGGRVAKVIRFPPRLLAIASAVAAAIIAAAIVIHRLSGGPAFVIPLHATTAAERIGDGAATAQAMARQAGQSWTVDMTVHGLKMLHGDQVYECWWARSGRTDLVVSGGTFIVDSSGSATVPMTTGVDPRDFRIMEITVESPGTGALHKPILFIGYTPPNQHL